MSCGCASCEDNLIIDPVVIPTGSNGTNGINGSNGDFGGYSADWLFETNTTDPPSSRYIRTNNNSLASVTTLYISQTNKGNIDYSNFLAEFTVDSYIRLFKEFDSSIFFLGKITSITDSGAYYTIGVTRVLSNGSFTNQDSLILSYSQTAIASNYTNVGNDATLADFNTTATAASQIARNITLTENPFAKTGDAIRIVFWGTVASAAPITNVLAYVEDSLSVAGDVQNITFQQDGYFKSTIEYIVTNYTLGYWKSTSSLALSDSTGTPTYIFIDNHGYSTGDPLDFINGTMKVKVKVSSSSGLANSITVQGLIVEKINML